MGNPIDKPAKPLYEFGPFRLDAEDRLLFKAGEVVPLPPKVLDILLALVERRGHLLEKDDLLHEVWRDTFVEEGNIARNVSTLRKILGENGDQVQYIETIPRRGYRFIGTVRELQDESTDVIIHERTRTNITFESDPADERSETKLIARTAGRSFWKWPLLAGLILTIGFASFWFIWYRARGVEFDDFKLTRLTTSGKVKSTVVSPDGKYVAYTVEDGTQQSLWLKPVGATGSLQIIPPADRGYFGLTFSRDGDYLYCGFASDSVTRAKLVRIATLGGSEIPVAEDVDSPAALSPDEKQIAFLRGYPPTKETAIMLANADGTEERKLVSVYDQDRFILYSNLAWTGGGKTIVGVMTSSRGVDRSVMLVEVDAASGSIRPFASQNWQQIGRIAPSPGGEGLIFTATEDRASPLAIWYVEYPAGPAKRITNDLGNYSDVSLTADGKLLVTLRSDQHSNIFIAPNGDAALAKQITSTNYDGAGGLSFTPDGKIVYATKTGGLSDLWIVNADGTGNKQLTFNSGNNRNPVVSPDGQLIAFVSSRTGATSLWLVEPDGGHLRQLTHGNNDDQPVWSPDGRSIVYVSRAGFTPNAFRIAVEGGDPIRLTGSYSSRPEVSPDGTLIACFYREQPNSPLQLGILPSGGGTPVRLIDIENPRFSRIAWTAEGQAIDFISAAGTASNIWQQPIDGGAPKQITNFADGQIFWFDRSRDHKTLAVARGTTESDACLLRFEP